MVPIEEKENQNIEMGGLGRNESSQRKMFHEMKTFFLVTHL